MFLHVLKPWTELVKLHPDVENGSLAEAVFAIDRLVYNPFTKGALKNNLDNFLPSYIGTDR